MARLLRVWETGGTSTGGRWKCFARLEDGAHHEAEVTHAASERRPGRRPPLPGVRQLASLREEQRPPQAHEALALRRLRHTSAVPGTKTRPRVDKLTASHPTALLEMTHDEVIRSATAEGFDCGCVAAAEPVRAENSSGLVTCGFARAAVMA